MSRPAIVALAVLLLAASAAVGWALRPVRVTHEEIAELERDLRAARAERADAERAATDARDERTTAEAPPSAPVTADAAAAPVDPAPTAEVAEPWRDRVAAYPLFPFAGAEPEVRDALHGVDWVVVAESMAALVPVTAEIATTLERGERPSAAAIGASQEHNGPLLTIAIRLHANGVPGTGVNGSFSHPAVLSNAIAATLEALGRPLPDEARERLAAVARDAAARDRARRAGYDAGTPELRRLVDEADLRRAFLEAAFALLDDGQTEALRPPQVRGRVALDLFSEGLVWVGRAVPLSFRDDAHLAELVAARVLGDAPEEVRERCAATVAAWVAAAPAAFRDGPVDALDRLGMVDAARATVCARQVLALVETLCADPDLDAATRTRLLGHGALVVPIRAETD